MQGPDVALGPTVEASHGVDSRTLSLRLRRGAGPVRTAVHELMVTTRSFTSGGAGRLLISKSPPIYISRAADVYVHVHRRHPRCTRFSNDLSGPRQLPAIHQSSGISRSDFLAERVRRRTFPLVSIFSPSHWHTR